MHPGDGDTCKCMILRCACRPSVSLLTYLYKTSLQCLSYNKHWVDGNWGTLLIF